MARKSAKPALTFPAVGETWMCRNGEQRQVVSIVNGYIDWKRISRLGSCNSGNSGTFDLRAWHTGSNPVLYRVEG